MAFPVSAELSSAAAWRGRRGLRQFSLVGLKINALNWTVAQTKSSGRARLVGAHPSPANTYWAEFCCDSHKRQDQSISSLRQLKSDLVQAKMPSFVLPTCWSCWLEWTWPGGHLGDGTAHLHTPGHHSEMHPWQQDPEPLDDADSHSYPLLNSSRERCIWDFGTNSDDISEKLWESAEVWN